jgi:5-hydroxyisourate hydrolase-like protein (transthyretin family)
LSVVRSARPRALVVLLAGVLVATMGLVRPAAAAGSASITGVVTDQDDQPIAGATVKVSGPGGYQTSIATDGDGRFRADRLAAGHYQVCFSADAQDLMRECWQDFEMGTGFTPVEVTDGQAVTDIDAELLPASYLRGTVTDRHGSPVEGVLVNERWYVDDMYSWGSSTLTAADGSFEIGPVSSGDHRLQFSDSGSDRYATEWWDNAPTAATSTPIQVVRGTSVDELEVTLDDLAHITGRVKGADGSPAAGTRVRLFKLNAAHSYTEVGNGSALTAAGRYDIAVQPGTYRLEFDAAPGMYRTEYWNDVRRFESAKDVDISGATPVTDVDAVLGLAPPVQLDSRPTISGRARVGEPLRAAPGAWDVSPLRFTYQWRVDGTAIPGAIERTLRLTPGLRGKQISVRVVAVATADERSPGHALARPTQPVAPRPR